MLVSLPLILSLVASVSAAVVDVHGERAVLEKRQALTLIMCKDLGLKPGSTGGCTSVTTGDNACSVSFKTITRDGGNWNDKVTSAAVALEGGRGFSCTLYEHANCAGRSLRITWKNDDLRQQGFNDIASSVRCNYN
ncbi:hypothetical protein HGRIS_006770 [Hohenbuehelia grisea]|uniref:Uncharacterized protein n=1 Tax=Hohenbuehelia grisea TaxID=104357 RepID=A0ABR3JAC4_9AGAR